MYEQGLKDLWCASVSHLLIFLGLKEEILRCRVPAQTFCVLLPVCVSAFFAHPRVHLLLPSGGWRVIGGGSCGNAGLLVMAAGLDLSRHGGCRGLGPSWFREVPGQWAQHLVRVLHHMTPGLRPRETEASPLPYESEQSPCTCTLGF